MLVFIDESGDPGFKIQRGSSPIFVTSMVIFQDAEAAQYAGNKITNLRRQLNIKPEFKFNKCANEARDSFFDEISDCNFLTRAVVVEKDKIYSPALRTVKESFYTFFIRMMVQNDAGMLVNAKVVIDGSGDPAFRKEFKSYLRKHIGPDCISKLDLKDSKRDPLIQLADMTAGAIARSYREDRPDARRWRSMLHRNGQISNVWDFK